MLGMTAFNLALYPAALRELSAALTDPRRPLAGSLRRQVEELRKRSEAFVGRYRVSREPASAELRVDGLVTLIERDGSLLLPVGKHQLELEAPGYAAFTRTLLIEGGEDEVLVLRMRSLVAATGLVAPPPASGPTTESRDTQGSLPMRSFADYPVSWTMGASTLALGLATGAVYVRAQTEQRSIEARCDGDCRPWQGVTDKRDKLERWGQGLLITSLVVAVATSVFAVLEHERVAKRRKMRVASSR